MNNEPVVLTARQNCIQSIKFVLFSCTAGIIQFVSFTLLFELVNWPYWISYLIALVLSVLYNFTINRRFTFKSAANIPIAMLLVALYYCVFTPVSTWGGDFLVENKGWNEFLVLIITMVLNMLTEFLFCRFVVYRNKLYTNDLGQKELALLHAAAGQQPDNSGIAASDTQDAPSVEPAEAAEPVETIEPDKPAPASDPEA